MVGLGEGVFETLKVVDSQPFAFTRHFARMAKSAAHLGIPVPDREQVRSTVDEHLVACPLSLGRLRFTWTVEERGAQLSVASEPIPQRAAAANLSIDTWAVDEHGRLAGIKSTRYENFAVARGRAQEAGADDALLMNRAGLLCETSTANIFYVLDGALCTPTLDSGCLPGIARGLVIELCDVVEIDRPPTVLENASEVFVTSSLREVQPVGRIGDRTYDVAGPVTAEAADAWQRLASVTWDPPLPDY